MTFMQPVLERFLERENDRHEEALRRIFWCQQLDSKQAYNILRKYGNLAEGVDVEASEFFARWLMNSAGSENIKGEATTVGVGWPDQERWVVCTKEEASLFYQRYNDRPMEYFQRQKIR